MNRFCNIFLLAGVFLLSGCVDAPDGKGAAKRPEVKTTATDVGKPPRFPEIIRMDIIYVEVPTGQASGSEEIWS
ncbi:MAG: hypothetical protein GY794_13335, partial [bacterium]|nr:hypothetical protein [bacterium]